MKCISLLLPSESVAGFILSSGTFSLTVVHYKMACKVVFLGVYISALYTDPLPL